MNQKEKLQFNIAAIEISLNWDGERKLLPIEVDVLKSYSGFGFCKAILFGDGTYQSWIDQGASENDLKLHEPMQKLFNLLIEHYGEKEYKKILSSLKSSVLSAYYTPEVIPATFYQVLKEFADIKNIYEPSTGSGIFITEAFKVFPDIEQVCAYEKDIITAKVVGTLLESQYGPTIYNKGFEESANKENGQYDLVATNPPYGDISVYDEGYEKNKLTRDWCKRIHNYFVAKSIDKLKNGGIGAWLITNAFLDTVSNPSIRRHLFSKCDFISLTIMPDNLMFETGGTHAPSHFLVVQKNESKKCLSGEEEELVHSDFTQTPKGKVAENAFIHQNRASITIGESRDGKNQYGKAAIEVKWDRPIQDIKEAFSEILHRDFNQRYKVNGLLTGTKGKASWNLSDVFSKASEIAIEKSGLSDMFKTREEWNEILNKEAPNTISDDQAKQMLQSTINVLIGKDDEIGENHENLTNDQEEVEDYTNSSTGGTSGPPLPELSELLPDFVPFKNGIIIEKDN